MVIGKTGVMVPCTIACTAIGMEGVSVAALVAVATGEGVMTKNVGVVSVGTAVPSAERVEEGVKEAGMLVFGALVGAGAAGGRLGWFMNSRTIATATEKRPPTSDQRARATYRCLTR